MITGGIRLIEKRYVLRIPPTRTVVTGCGVVQPEEGKRIHIVRAPPSPEDSFVLEFRARSQRSFLLHYLDRNGDAEILLPLSLDKLGHWNVASVGINGYLNLIDRKLLRIKLARAISVSRLGQQSLRFLRIEWIAFWLGIAGKHSFGSDCRQGFGMPPGGHRHL